MNAAKITRESKSNLALAFVSLGRERRHDITIFYAFCRVIDDIADSTELRPERKRTASRPGGSGFAKARRGEPALAREVRAPLSRSMPSRRRCSKRSSTAWKWICGTSVTRRFEELRLYCYRVASAVGLVSIEIFGYRNPPAATMPSNWGLALQMTNIIRDVGKDLSNGRIYLPQEELARFDYSESDLRRPQIQRALSCA